MWRLNGERRCCPLLGEMAKSEDKCGFHSMQNGWSSVIKTLSVDLERKSMGGCLDGSYSLQAVWCDWSLDHTVIHLSVRPLSDFGLDSFTLLVELAQMTLLGDWDGVIHHTKHQEIFQTVLMNDIDYGTKENNFLIIRSSATNENVFTIKLLSVQTCGVIFKNANVYMFDFF